MSDGRRGGRRDRGARAVAGALALVGVVAAGAAIAPDAVGQTATQPAAVTQVPATATARPTFVASVPPGAPAVSTATASASGGAPIATIATTAVATATSVAATSTTAPTRGPEGFRSSTAVLGEVVWARSVDPDTGEPDRRATAFITTDPVIYAAIPVERIAAGVTISVTWTYDGQLVPELSHAVTTIAEARPGWLLFHLDRPEEQIWPVGGYVIDVFVDGQFALKADILVGVPPS